MPIFEDADRGTHPEDLMVLQQGHVHFVRHPWALDRLRQDLETLGYDFAVADLGDCEHADDVRDAVIAAVPGWPRGYSARNWMAFSDGLTDCLLDADHPQRVLILDHFGRYYADHQDDAMVLLDELAGVGRWHLLFGRRLIVLLVSDDPELQLDPVGAEHVGWNRHE
ncbi:hypothetical protein HDA40_002437 [Hamadaea flava]|uniref:Barstar (Barnase inhibitor) n=1 Tax=Hamadaea flava TaxID=1742688 RepID=A0ABV8LLM8_9ACTN|nr:hypothetical protein [Hamadaea flava]MCP2323930.1 hypothetical protein [Hamadaea flava]